MYTFPFVLFQFEAGDSPSLVASTRIHWPSPVAMSNDTGRVDPIISKLLTLRDSACPAAQYLALSPGGSLGSLLGAGVRAPASFLFTSLLLPP